MTIMNLYDNDDVNLVEEEMSYFGTIPLFDGFRFIGWTRDVTTVDEDGETLGYESPDGHYYIPVFYKNFYNQIMSDEEEREQDAIDAGKNCVVFVHGSKTDSYILRYTSKEIKHIDFSFFDDHDVFNGFHYNS